ADSGGSAAAIALSSTADEPIRPAAFLSVRTARSAVSAVREPLGRTFDLAGGVLQTVQEALGPRKLCCKKGKAQQDGQPPRPGQHQQNNTNQEKGKSDHDLHDSLRLPQRLDHARSSAPIGSGPNTIIRDIYAAVQLGER